MPILLDCSPFSDKSDEIVICGERVHLRSNQIILWLTLSLHRAAPPSHTARPFPAILDTGHNHTFSINERHLHAWAGLRLDSMNPLAAIRDRVQRIVLRAASIWVHPNSNGSRERLADKPPIEINADTGIAVYPGNDFPRLPILGLRAIAENGLILKIDGPRRQATLWTPYRWWPFF